MLLRLIGAALIILIALQIRRLNGRGRIVHPLLVGEMVVDALVDAELVMLSLDVDVTVAL